MDDLQKPDEKPTEPNKSVQPPISKKTITATKLEFGYSGPIPPPQLFRAYNEVVPGAGDRILCMAERESNHRQTCEHKILNHKFTLNLFGQIFALAITIVALVLGTKCILAGKPITGTIIGGTPICGLAIAFIKTHANAKTEKYENEENE
jgi:uncharacterized membrane protein